MPQVDFYVLGAAGRDACAVFACRLTEKAYKLSHRVHLQVDDASDAARIDELLWTFRDGSFVPHEVLERDRGESPVTIGYGDRLPAEPDLLINLSAAIPDGAGRFRRIAEIVDADAERRQASRRRFAEYRQQGYPLESHTID